MRNRIINLNSVVFVLCLSGTIFAIVAGKPISAVVQFGLAILNFLCALDIFNENCPQMTKMKNRKDTERTRKRVRLPFKPALSSADIFSHRQQLRALGVGQKAVKGCDERFRKEFGSFK